MREEKSGETSPVRYTQPVKGPLAAAGIPGTLLLSPEKIVIATVAGGGKKSFT